MWRNAVSVLVITGLLATAAGFSPQIARYRHLLGKVAIDGSSTVYPITEAVAEEFGYIAPRVALPIGVSGTGGGFKRFIAGEIDLSNASRPIRPRELEAAHRAGLELIELPIAYDGLSLVVNPQNDWADQLTVDELRRIFRAGSQIDSWDDVRSHWPEIPLTLYSPGTDSGTFDYFKEVIAGDEGSIRADMSVSEDDNALIRGVAGDRGALGFFGYAYFDENREMLKALRIVNPDTGEAVAPTPETIESGRYAPFSRPLFIYVNRASAERPEVDAFVTFYLMDAPFLAGEVGYVSLPPHFYDAARQRFEARRTGTAYVDDHGEQIHPSLPEALGLQFPHG